MDYLRKRMTEASTWGALGLLMSCIGDVVIKGPTASTVTALVLGLVAVFVPEGRSGAGR